MRSLWLRICILAVLVIALSQCGVLNAQNRPSLNDTSKRLQGSLKDGWELTGSRDIKPATTAPWREIFPHAVEGYDFSFENRDKTVECASGKGEKATEKVHPFFELWVIPFSPAVTQASLQQDYEKSQRSPIQVRHPSALGTSRVMAIFVVYGCGDLGEDAESRVSKEFQLKPFDRQ